VRAVLADAHVERLPPARRASLAAGHRFVAMAVAAWAGSMDGVALSEADVRVLFERALALYNEAVGRG